MKNILKYIFNIEMIKIYLVNILLADPAYLLILVILKTMLPFMYDETPLYAQFWVLFLIMLGRLFVLPIFYNKLEKSGGNKYTQQFLYNLRHSIKTKILVLLVSPLPLVMEIGKSKTSSIFQYLLSMYGFSLVFGLFGSYVVLFLYWYIKDKINKKAG